MSIRSAIFCWLNPVAFLAAFKLCAKSCEYSCFSIDNIPFRCYNKAQEDGSLWSVLVVPLLTSLVLVENAVAAYVVTVISLWCCLEHQKQPRREVKGVSILRLNSFRCPPFWEQPAVLLAFLSLGFPCDNCIIPRIAWIVDPFFQIFRKIFQPPILPPIFGRFFAFWGWVHTGCKTVHLEKIFRSTKTKWHFVGEKIPLF